MNLGSTIWVVEKKKNGTETEFQGHNKRNHFHLEHWKYNYLFNQRLSPSILVLSLWENLTPVLAFLPGIGADVTHYCLLFAILFYLTLNSNKKFHLKSDSPGWALLVHDMFYISIPIRGPHLKSFSSFFWLKSSNWFS